jgi:hypothetical protein
MAPELAKGLLAELMKNKINSNITDEAIPEESKLEEEPVKKTTRKISKKK